MKLLISEIILISLTFINESETKKAKPKPNVVIIMSDDMVSRTTTLECASEAHSIKLIPLPDLCIGLE